MFKYILSFLVFSIVFTSGFAQVSFSNEPTIFIDEFMVFMKKSKKDAVLKSVETFSQNWKTNKFTPEQKKFMISISNNLAFKNLPRDPYFEMMLSNLELYFEKKLNTRILAQWQDITKALLEKSPKDYLSFLESMNLLFKDNTLVQLNGQRWYATNNNFEITFEKNKVGIVFKNIELICQATVDKIKILNCIGTFYPGKNTWVGTQGRINFERVGKPESEVYVEFKDHRLNLNNSGFYIDSALMTYPKISATKLLGKLTERVSQSSSPEEIKMFSYPQFVAYEPSIEINGIVGKGAIYKGGFSMSGNKVNSQSFGNGLGSITLLYKGMPMIVATSDAFRLDSNKVVSLHAAISIKVDTGFITHPNALFNYNIDSQKVVINRSNEGLMGMPFSDNYHGVEIESDQIKWTQNAPYIDFVMTNKNSAAFVETNSFFKKFLFDRQQGALNLNPLIKIYQYCRETKQRSFSVQDYASAIRSKKEYLIQPLMRLADDGFIYYLKDQDSIIVKDKLYNWNANNVGSRDYDIIRLQSIIGSKPNITYNINTHDLKMEGVRKFTFSDSQNVVAVPNEQLVVFKKDKNMVFSGMMRAGRIDFYSKNFSFNYSQFQINNTTMDSMVIFYPDYNSNSLRKVQSVLSNTYGRILIDKPNNKSGLKDYAEYPIFIAERGSEINYERAATHNYAYKKETFKFEVDPFILDSLDNFTIAGFGFKGRLVSDGIFPVMENTARIQPDYSLGFVDKVKLPMYGGKGTADLTINLSNRGFYGNGDIIYQTSISKSPEFLLLPDATVGVSTSFNLPESAKYPLVAGYNVNTQWYPKQDKMFQSSIDSHFTVFKSKYDFEGKLTLSPPDLRGDGKLKWPDAVFASNEMVFGKNKSTATSSSIKIFSVDPAKFAFENNDVKGDVDFDKKEGKFISNVLGAYTHFPFNNFSSNMNDYKWDMVKKTMEMKPNTLMAAIKPMFAGLMQNTSDSLKFECAYAKFDLVNFVINMEKIPYIDVADSRVYPFAGKAIVREKAVMDRLDSSRIEANKIDKFHDIKNCKTTILGGSSLASSGYYRYIDKYKIEQPLFIDSIRINKEKNLVGFGKISEAKFLKLDKKIAFKGLYSINSTRKPIDFIGYVKPLSGFAYINSLWIRYKKEVDPQNVVIDVNEPRDFDNKRLSIGLYFANDSNHVYPMLFNFKRRYSDPELQSDTGIMFYDDAKDAFFIGNKEKLLEKALKGNYMELNEKTKTVFTEGAYNFGFVDPKVSLKSAGNASFDPKDSTYRFKLMMQVNFPYASDINKLIVKMLTTEGFGTAASTTNNEYNLKAVSELINDPNASEKIMNGLEKNGILIPDAEFSNGMVFTDVDFAYNWVRRKFIAAGPIQMALSGGIVVNKKFNTTIALEKKRGGDKLYVYLLGENQEWIYFEYSKGSMVIASSNAELNAAVLLAAEKGVDEQFYLRVGTERQKDNFLKRNDIELDE